MVKEAYCSFEIAKLLKEKGFDEPCLKNYWDSDKELHNWNWSLEFHTNKERNLNTKDCAAPTHQMAMAWLREKHLYIEIRRNVNTYLFGAIIIRDGEESYNRIVNHYDTYEEAVEAALSYCLTNLI